MTTSAQIFIQLHSKPFRQQVRKLSFNPELEKDRRVL